jgi:hypothetical protein
MRNSAENSKLCLDRFGLAPLYFSTLSLLRELEARGGAA